MEQSTDQALDITDAARVLGISTAALRKRIKRNRIDAFKGQDGRWKVFIPEPEPDPVEQWAANRAAAARAQVEAEREPKGPALDQMLIDELKDQITFLKESLRTRDDEIQRRDVLLQQVANRIPELPAPGDPMPSSGDTTIMVGSHDSEINEELLDLRSENASLKKKLMKAEAKFNGLRQATFGLIAFLEGKFK